MNIDRLAPWYRLVEYCAFGRALERRRFAFLSKLKTAHKILVLGEGDGRALLRLQNLAQQASIHVVELSGAMIALARRRISGAPQIHFQQADARTAEFGQEQFDGITTFFFLDCFKEPEALSVVLRLTQALKPGGLWLITDFAVPPSGWQRWYAALWIWIMYRFFRITTGLQASRLPPINDLLNAAGLALIAEEQEHAGMIISQVWQRPAKPPAGAAHSAGKSQHAIPAAGPPTAQYPPHAESDRR